MLDFLFCIFISITVLESLSTNDTNGVVIVILVLSICYVQNIFFFLLVMGFFPSAK